jgi:hypothetical protein
MNAFFHDPPLSVGLAVLAAYLVGLGVVLLRRRPLAVSGGLDGGLLAAALSGLVMAGPLAAVRPLLAAVPWNGPLLVIAYVVGVAGLLLLARPRLVVYNCTVEQLRPLVVEAVAALDSAARWAGESAALPTKNLQIHLDDRGLRAVSLVAVGGRPSLESWGELCGSLRPALRAMRVRPSLLGWMLLAAACLLLAVSLLMGLEDLPWRA